MKNLLQPESWPMRFLSRVFDLLMLNLLLDFLCLTIVLIGSVITSLYSLSFKMMYQEEDEVLKPFFRGIRDNIVPSFPATLLLFVDVLLIAVCHEALFAEVLLFSPILLIGLVIVALLLTALLSYLFPLIARFENTFPRHLGNAVRLALANLPVTCLVTQINLLPYLSLVLFPQNGYLIGFWVLIGIAGGVYVNSYYLRGVFEQNS